VQRVNRRDVRQAGERLEEGLVVPFDGAEVELCGADLPEPVDLVVITVPAKGFDEAVDDALAAGATAIVAITSGFAELGDEGRATQVAVAERIRAAGAVLLGPNCLGVYDASSDLGLASNEFPSALPMLLRVTSSAMKMATGASCKRLQTVSMAVMKPETPSTAELEIATSMAIVPAM